MCVLEFVLYAECRCTKFDHKPIYCTEFMEFSPQPKSWTKTVLVERGQPALEHHAGKGDRDIKIGKMVYLYRTDHSDQSISWILCPNKEYKRTGTLYMCLLHEWLKAENDKEAASQSATMKAGKHGPGGILMRAGNIPPVHESAIELAIQAPITELEADDAAGWEEIQRMKKKSQTNKRKRKELYIPHFRYEKLSEKTSKQGLERFPAELSSEKL